MIRAAARSKSRRRRHVVSIACRAEKQRTSICALRARHTTSSKKHKSLFSVCKHQNARNLKWSASQRAALEKKRKPDEKKSSFPSKFQKFSRARTYIRATRSRRPSIAVRVSARSIALAEKESMRTALSCCRWPAGKRRALSGAQRRHVKCVRFVAYRKNGVRDLTSVIKKFY